MSPVLLACFTKTSPRSDAHFVILTFAFSTSKATSLICLFDSLSIVSTQPLTSDSSCSKLACLSSVSKSLVLLSSFMLLTSALVVCTFFFKLLTISLIPLISSSFIFICLRNSASELGGLLLLLSLFKFTN